MKIKLSKINIVTVELIGILLLHIGEIALRFPCNHANALMFHYRDCIFAMLLFEIGHSVFKREICLAFWLIFLLSFLVPTIEDKCNILVSYDTWISRGMPEWGQ